MTRQEKLFRKLKALATPTPITPPLPTRADILRVERALGVHLPPTYHAYLLELSNLSIGTYEPLVPHLDLPYLSLLANTENFHRVGMPAFLTPFVQDNGDALCFDVQSHAPEFEVALWTHDVQSVARRWPDFLDWIEEEWLPSCEPI